MNLADYRDRFLKHLRDDIMRFWVEHGLDTEYGGFHGSLGLSGEPEEPSAKSLVQHTSTLWSFSAAAQFDPKPEYKKGADQALDFLKKYFYDEKHGGWYMLVSREGMPLDKNKHLYAHSFAVYGLCEYARAFNNREALTLATETFDKLEEMAHEEQYKGYNESFSESWQPRPIKKYFLAYPCGCADPFLEKWAPIPEDYKKDGTEGFWKTMNTHIHLLESLTNLYKATNDPKIKERLNELINVCGDTMIDRKRGCLDIFFEKDWTPLLWKVSYGHDIELSWLLTKAAEASRRENSDSVKETVLLLARRVMERGLDREKGGLFNEGHERTGERIDTHKIWWIQAEALIGFLNAYQLSGDKAFLDAFSNVADWVFEKQIDRRLGEWYQVILSDDTVYGGLGGLWKTPYHTARACIEIVRRLGTMS